MSACCQSQIRVQNGGHVLHFACVRITLSITRGERYCITNARLDAEQNALGRIATLHQLLLLFADQNHAEPIFFGRVVQENQHQR